MEEIGLIGKEKLNRFISTLIDTNRGFDFFVDWTKVEDVDEYKIELHAMDAFIKNSDFDNTFRNLLKKMPAVVAVFPLLLALAKNERDNYVNGKKALCIVDTEDSQVIIRNYRFNARAFSDDDIEVYLEYFTKTGLKDFFLKSLERSVIDYATGVLVGLDSNGRKQRSGKAFEAMCAPIIREAAKKYGFECHEQVRLSLLEKRGMKIHKDIAGRIADFLLIKGDDIIDIEVNFFNGGGSKPEEIISSYIYRQEELKNHGIDFVFITDGANCWSSKDKPQLNKAFQAIENIMNLHMAKEGMLSEVLEDLTNKKG